TTRFRSAEVAEAVRNARRLIQEGGAAAVKIEGGRAIVDVAARLVEIGVPVMGHLGLVPQSVHQLGGFGRQAKLVKDAEQLVTDAHALAEAGVFSLVLESIPHDLARRVTEELEIPTIGIGAGPHCDGQVLVSYDALGMFDEFVPPFVKQYARLGDEIVKAAVSYAGEVREGKFPEE
ncbi:MAG: 3-methyl-2-oxobutanoate hydroxymethyltransferase, partial [bacterium]|nr:3-methyl-2-oxobutanoate hydroxymethyltransferase [bacterium]